MKKEFEKISSIDLVKILQYDYEVFSEHVEYSFPQIADDITKKRKMILEILMEREG